MDARGNCRLTSVPWIRSIPKSRGDGTTLKYESLYAIKVGRFKRSVQYLRRLRQSDIARPLRPAQFDGRGPRTRKNGSVETTTPPFDLLQPRRKIEGISAILLPFDTDGAVDWPAFERHVERTRADGLTPAVNMDTGYIHLLDSETRLAVLDRSQSALGNSRFVAGAFVSDGPASPFQLDVYKERIDEIQSRGGTPIVFPSHGLTRQAPSAILDSYREIAKQTDRFLAFELGTMFAPFGAIYDLDTYRGLLEIPQCVGAKHSSLSRPLEWDRLRLRNRVRPDFRVYTGNDLAIDMVMYGSDYLLGLSTFAPDLFAKRDALWEAGDPAFFEWNDLLQYLGFFAFRSPVPAYRHSAAQFLKLRGWIECDKPHPKSPSRPDSDREVLREMAERMGIAGGVS